MTQIKKTLGIAGIIAMVGAPAMAEIASTQYVQNIVNNIIPTSGMVGDVLKKTADGVEWAAAPGAPENVLTNKSDAENAIAIGGDEHTYAESGSVAIGANAASDAINSVAIGMGAYTMSDMMDVIAIGREAFGSYGVAIGAEAYASSGIAIGNGAAVDGGIAIDGVSSSSSGSYVIAIGGDVHLEDETISAIQLGPGLNTTHGTFKVGFQDLYGEGENYTLLGADGKIPYERFASEIPNTCKAANGQKCALVITWDSSAGEFTRGWEVVKSNQ